MSIGHGPVKFALAPDSPHAPWLALRVPMSVDLDPMKMLLNLGHIPVKLAVAPDQLA